MLKEKAELFRKINILLDLCTTAISFLIAHAIRSSLDTTLTSTAGLVKYLSLLYIALPAWYIALNFNNLYDSQRTNSLPRIAWAIVKSVAEGLAFLMVAGYLLKLHWVSRAFLLLFGLVDILLLFVQRVITTLILRRIREKGYNFRRVLIVGTGSRAKDLAAKILANRSWGLKIYGFLAQDAPSVGKALEGGKVIGTLDDLQRIISSHPIDEVHIALPLLNLDTITRVLEVCEEQGIRTRVMIDLYSPTISKIRLGDFHGTPMLTFTATPMETWQMVIKQACDILGALALLVLTLPLFAVIAIAIKLDSKGPVFFVQERIGLYKRRFKMYKFRTMIENAEELKPSLAALNELSGPVFKIRNDPRCTRVGRLLRQTSLDELPQLLNVLKGEMSFIGPRPPVPEEVERYESWQYRRLSMKPGISGLWQVSGRTNIDFNTWMALDLHYIDNWSLKLDLIIFLKTLPAILLGRGAF